MVKNIERKFKITADIKEAEDRIKETKKLLSSINKVKINPDLDTKSISSAEKAILSTEDSLKKQLKHLKDIGQTYAKFSSGGAGPQKLKDLMEIKLNILKSESAELQKHLGLLDNKKRKISDIKRNTLMSANQITRDTGIMAAQNYLSSRATSSGGGRGDSRGQRALRNIGGGLAASGIKSAGAGGLLGMLGVAGGTIAGAASLPLLLAGGASIAGLGYGAYRAYQGYGHRSAQAPTRALLSARGLSLGSRGLTNLLTGRNAAGSMFTEMGYGPNETLQQMIAAQQATGLGGSREMDFTMANLTSMAQTYGRAFGAEPGQITDLFGAVRRGAPDQEAATKRYADILGTTIAAEIDKGKIPELLSNVSDAITKQAALGIDAATGLAQLFQRLGGSGMFAASPGMLGSMMGGVTQTMQKASNQPGSPLFGAWAKTLHQLVPGLGGLELQRVMAKGLGGFTSEGISNLPKPTQKKLTALGDRLNPLVLLQQAKQSVSRMVGGDELSTTAVLSRMFGLTLDQTTELENAIEEAGGAEKIDPRKAKELVSRVTKQDKRALQIKARKEAIETAVGEGALEAGQTLETAMLNLQQKTLPRMAEGIDSIHQLMRQQMGLPETRETRTGPKSQEIEDLYKMINDPEEFMKSMRRISSGRSTFKQERSYYSGGGGSRAAAKVSIGSMPEETNKAIMSAARQLGMDPATMAGIVYEETAKTGDPQARNPHSSASGLIQFMSATAKELGVSIDDIRNMSAEEQVPLIVKYFKKRGWKPGMSDLQAYSTVHAGSPNANVVDATGTGTSSFFSSNVKPAIEGFRKIGFGKKTQASIGSTGPLGENGTSNVDFDLIGNKEDPFGINRSLSMSGGFSGDESKNDIVAAVKEVNDSVNKLAGVVSEANDLNTADKSIKNSPNTNKTKVDFLFNRK